MTSITENFYGTSDQNAVDLLCNWNCFLASDAKNMQPGWIIQLPNGLHYADALGNCHHYYLDMDLVGGELYNAAVVDTCISGGNCCGVLRGRVGNSEVDWITNGLQGVGIGLNYPPGSSWGAFGCGGSSVSCCP